MTEQDVRDWFAALQDCVQAVDFAAARPLFALDAIGFGTKATIATGLEALEANQWRGIWPNITDFRFRTEDLRWGSDDHFAWAVATWTSTGYGLDGAPFDRPGRATLVFCCREGSWVALHSHFSLAPGTPAVTQRPGTR